MIALPLFLFACVEYELGRDTGTPDAPEDTALETAVEPIDTAPEEPIAEAPVYANTANELFEVEPLTGQRTLIGSFRDAYSGQPVERFVDIAIDLQGHLFGGTSDALYRIDPNTAAVTKVCDTDLRMYALAFTSDDVLFAGAGDQIVRVDMSTCRGVALVDGGEYETSGDLVGLPDGYLYWTVKGRDSDALVRVDPRSGGATFVGNVAVSDVFGLGYDEGQLYGFSKDGSIVRIDPRYASTTMLVPASDTTSWWGATTNPVVWQ